MPDPHATPDRAADGEPVYHVDLSMLVYRDYSTDAITDAIAEALDHLPSWIDATGWTIVPVVERVIADALDECDRAQTHWSKRPEIVARALEREGLIR